MKRALLVATGTALLLAASALAQSGPRQLLVTVAERPADPLAHPLTAVEFEVRVGKQPAEVLRVYQPEERPVQLALLIDDSAGTPVAGSLDELAAFLRSLPRGSEVMIAYLRRGKLVTAQAFTSNLEGAANSLRAPSGFAGAGPADLAQLVYEVLQLFPQPRTFGDAARAQILYLGEGTNADPHTDIPLQRTLRQARARGIPVWAIHVHGAVPFSSPPAEPASTANQEAYLDWLTQETGGMTFGLSLHSLSLDPHLRRFRAMLDRQYLVEIDSPDADGPLRIRIRRQQLDLLYPRR
ncbi:hypothetical protein MYX77_03835 [Acidobacteriia bacterium AH_259_A11_L15]|nr:hypothetical protein [Acidobacteriia bacterium AH_259_A11_L15]